MEDREFRYALMGLLGFREILDRITKLEERFAKLEEIFSKLEERVMKLEERYQELAERMARVEERLERLDRTVIVIAHRFGILSEAGFRETMKYIVEDILGVAKVEKWVYRDEEGLVYGYPATVEVDVVVRDRSDIVELYRIESSTRRFVE